MIGLRYASTCKDNNARARRLEPEGHGFESLFPQRTSYFHESVLA